MRFDENDRLIMIRMINAGKTYKHMLATLGKEDAHKSYEHTNSYYRYGMMTGEKTKVTFSETISKRYDDDGRVWGWGNTDNYLTVERM